MLVDLVDADDYVTLEGLEPSFDDTGLAETLDAINRKYGASTRASDGPAYAGRAGWKRNPGERGGPDANACRPVLRPDGTR